MIVGLSATHIDLILNLILTKLKHNDWLLTKQCGDIVIFENTIKSPELFPKTHFEQTDDESKYETDFKLLLAREI